MATLIQCDKCGKIMKSGRVYTIETDDKCFDFCEMCYNKVMAFVKRKDDASCNDQTKSNTT